MTDHSEQSDARQLELLEDAEVRSLLDQLLEDSRLYTSSSDYRALLDFVVRLRNFAPFNAMLLQVQKPGLSYAASARDWRERFGRYPKEAARPLIILWPFGPVALVYDVMDTEGEPLPEDVASFIARGPVDEAFLIGLPVKLARRGIHCEFVDAGDHSAGLIRVVYRAKNEKETNRYRIHINRNHNAPVKLATFAHELGHLGLGHLGPDKKLGVPSRLGLARDERELEAESVAYIVCRRNGVEVKSQTYLVNFLGTDTTADGLDVYQVMRAAGRVETWLGLEAHASFDRPPRSRAEAAQRT